MHATNAFMALLGAFCDLYKQQPHIPQLISAEYALEEINQSFSEVFKCREWTFEKTLDEITQKLNLQKAELPTFDMLNLENEIEEMALNLEVCFYY
jgi:hypothetical protein